MAPTIRFKDASRTEALEQGYAACLKRTYSYGKGVNLPSTVTAGFVTERPEQVRSARSRRDGRILGAAQLHGAHATLQCTAGFIKNRPSRSQMVVTRRSTIVRPTP